MREIKFRAWDSKQKKMRQIGVYDGKAFPFYAPGESTNCPFCAPDWEDLDDVFSDPMQYTGLKDKNGKEIYEGDIVNWFTEDLEFGDMGECCGGSGVVNSTPVTKVEKIWWEDGSWRIDNRIKHQFNQYHASMCEVIGTIHENPELLK